MQCMHILRNAFASTQTNALAKVVGVFGIVFISVTCDTCYPKIRSIVCPDGTFSYFETIIDSAFELSSRLWREYYGDAKV